MQDQVILEQLKKHRKEMGDLIAHYERMKYMEEGESEKRSEDDLDWSEGYYYGLAMARSLVIDDLESRLQGLEYLINKIEEVQDE